jgi:prophage regulatory protein
MQIKFLRIKSVCELLDLPYQTFVDQVNNGLFTKQVKLGLRVAVWPAHEIEAVMRARYAGKSEEQIKKLVQALHDQRQTPNAFNGPAAVLAAEAQAA